MPSRRRLRTPSRTASGRRRIKVKCRPCALRSFEPRLKRGRKLSLGIDVFEVEAAGESCQVFAVRDKSISTVRVFPMLFRLHPAAVLVVPERLVFVEGEYLAQQRPDVHPQPALIRSFV